MHSVFVKLVDRGNASRSHTVIVVVYAMTPMMAMMEAEKLAMDSVDPTRAGFWRVSDSYLADATIINVNVHVHP